MGPMRRKRLLQILGSTVALLIAVSACDEAGTGGVADSTTTVTDKWEAQSVARGIDAAAGNVRLPHPSTTNWNESYNDLVVPGTNGTVRVTGSYTRSYTSTSSFNSNTVTVDVTFQFIDYYYSPHGLTMTGFLEYYTRSYRSTTGYSSSSSFRKTAEGSSIIIQKPHSDEDYMTQDTVSVRFSDKNGNQFMVTGTLTSSTGEVFSF